MNRKDDGKNTTKSILSNSVTSVISIIVSLISTILITKIISLSDLGIATSFVSLKSIVTLICLLSVYISINRMILDVHGDDYTFLSSIYIFSSLFCIFSYFIYFIFRGIINDLVGFDTKMMTLMFTLIFLVNACTLLVNYWNFKNKYKLLFIYNLLASPMAQILSLIFAYLLSSHKYLGRILGVELFNVVFGVGCGIFILYKGKFKVNFKYIKNALKICVPMIPHLLAQILLSSCDLLMIKNIVGSDSAGLYSMAYTISNILYTLLIQLFMPWSPWVYRRIKNNEIDSIRSNSKLLIIASWVLCIGLFTVAPEMIKLFLSSDYYNASYIVAPITVGIYFQVMYILFYDIEYYHKKNKQIAIFSVITAILNLVLNYIFINIYGYIAAAYTTLISYGVLLTLHYIGMKRVDKRNFYDIKLLFALSILAFVISIIYVFSDNNIYIRYCILIFILIICCIKYKNYVINLLSTFRRKKDES